MNPQVQLWMPAVLSLFGTLIVVVLTGWINTRMLSAQIEAVRSEINALRAEMKAELAELRLEFHRDLSELRAEIAELRHRVERLEETRGLIRP